MCIQWAWPFADPVDTARYPDYLKVVHNPMDLRLVKRKADGGEYATPANFCGRLSPGLCECAHLQSSRLGRVRHGQHSAGMHS